MLKKLILGLPETNWDTGHKGGRVNAIGWVSPLQNVQFSSGGLISHVCRWTSQSQITQASHSLNQSGIMLKLRFLASNISFKLSYVENKHHSQMYQHRNTRCYVTC
ncbi:UNVERIFIED_CONTAM: hypothetical protein K2H54_026272 [Gekko kuhli]